MTESLPRGWQFAALGEVCTKPQYGWTSPAAKTGSLRYLRTTDISSGEIEWGTVPFCSKQPDDVAKYLVAENDILVSRAGSVGVSILIEDVPIESVFASYLIRFRPLSGIEPKYISLFLLSDQYWRSISELAAGIAVPNVNATKLASLRVPIPPGPEQRRIVEQLTKLLLRVESIGQRLDRIPDLLRRFRQSVLNAACSGTLTEDMRGDAEQDDLPTGWSTVPLDKLLPDSGGLFDGPFGSNLKTSDYTESGVRVIRLENIGHLKFFDDKRAHISQQKYASLRKHTVREGDIIFSSFISDQIRICVLPPLSGPAIAKADCFCIRPSEDQIDPNYLAYQLATGYSHDRLIESIHGATRPRINTKQLKRLAIRLCPLNEQQEIVRRVRDLLSLADQLENHYESAKKSVDTLTPSILAKAFRGELVPQDPNDEPAEKLLERIKAEREHNPTKTRRIRKTHRKKGNKKATKKLPTMK